MVAFNSKPLAPTGMHMATCYRIIDLGTQEVAIPGKPITHSAKIHFDFELPTKLMDSGYPFSVGTDFTVSTSDKGNLAPFILAWMGERLSKSFNFKKLLGVPALINVIHNERETYEKIASIAPLMEGQVAPKPVNPLVYFDLEAFDMGVYAKLPEFYQTKIAASPEYKNIINPKPKEKVVFDDSNPPIDEERPF